MIYHITDAHRLPSLKELPQDAIKKSEEAFDLIKKIINARTIEASVLQNQYVRLNSHVISLEALFKSLYPTST